MNKNLIVGGVLAVIGMFMLVISVPALLVFRSVELSNDFILGAFAATLLQTIIAIVLMYFAYKYLSKVNQ
ncbi:MAG: hypothetical protein QXO37_08710 [Candidatus Nitrosocaldaceae archaeon]